MAIAGIALRQAEYYHERHAFLTLITSDDLNPNEIRHPFTSNRYTLLATPHRQGMQQESPQESTQTA
jgi:hypothetical protein